MAEYFTLTYDIAAVLGVDPAGLDIVHAFVTSQYAGIADTDTNIVKPGTWALEIDATTTAGSVELPSTVDDAFNPAGAMYLVEVKYNDRPSGKTVAWRSSPPKQYFAMDADKNLADVVAEPVTVVTEAMRDDIYATAQLLNEQSAATDSQVETSLETRGLPTTGAELSATYASLDLAWVDVDKGLLEDPEDDDWMTTQIQALIDEAEAAVAAGLMRTLTLRFSAERIYDVTSLAVGTGVKLDGNGARLRFRSGSDFAGIYTRGADPDFSGGDGTTVVTDVEITGFLFDNQGDTVQGRRSQITRFENAQRVRVLHNRFVNVGPKVAIRFDTNTTDFEAGHNHIELPDDNPFLTVSNAQGISCHSETVDNYSGGYMPGTDDVTFVEPTNLCRRGRVYSNRIYGGTHGISLWGAQYVQVHDNYLENQSHRSIIMSPRASRITVTDNIGKDFGQAFILMAYGSYHCTVIGNHGETTKSVGEMDGIRCSWGAEACEIIGNTVQGVGGKGFRAFTGATKIVFRGNTARNCHVGFQLQSLVTSTGYSQPITTPAMVGNVLDDNAAFDCDISYQVWQGTTTAAGTTTPPTTAGVAVPLRDCTIKDNFSYNAATAHYNFVEDTSGNLSDLTASGNEHRAGGSTWQLPRGLAHFRYFRNTGQNDVDHANLLTSGEATLERHMLNNSLTMTDGQLRLAYFTARKSEDINFIRVMTTTTAAGATPTVTRFGLFRVNADETLTLVASTVNDTALLNLANKRFTKALSATFSKVAGQRYAIGVLVKTGATAPTIAGYVSVGDPDEAAEAPRLSAVYTGQTDMPASLAAPTSSNNTAGRIYAAVTP